MGRLSRYLLRLFSFEAMALFAVAAFLLFLIQCLRLFDIVADRGQSLLTLLGQAILGMPSLGVVVFYVCLGIGLGRALRGLQESSELLVIHASALLHSLMRAAVVYAIGGTLVVLLLAHVVDPLSNRTTRVWSENIAADLVSRSMVPHRFTEVLGGVSMVIGSRDSQGQITDFFMDDSRDGELRRTYLAKRALITRDEEGYILRMFDGAIQQLVDNERMSEISFARYDIALDDLTGDPGTNDALAQTSSLDILSRWLSNGSVSYDEIRALVRRSAEGLRVLAMSLFVVAVTAFPSGNRRRAGAPIELTVLAAAFIERGLTSYAPAPQNWDLVSGSLLLALAGAALLAYKLRIFRPAPLRRTAA